MNKIRWMVLSIVVVAGCQYRQPDYLQMIDAQTLNEAMRKTDVFLVDVHVPQQPHIKGTDLVVPYDKVEQNLGAFPANKHTPIYLYCEAGPMGNAAARSLHALGYTHLFNLSGGAIAWRKAGFPFE